MRDRSPAAVPVHKVGNRTVTMGSIDSNIFRTTLASFAPVLVAPTGAIRIAPALRGAIGTSSVRLSRRFGRPATA